MQKVRKGPKNDQNFAYLAEKAGFTSIKPVFFGFKAERTSFLVFEIRIPFTSE